jgi:hypothetical protein
MVEDQELIAELTRFPEGSEREAFALAALRIGLLTLKQAQGRIDSELVARETDRLSEKVTGVLKEYFDPSDGKFTERVSRLIRKDGELEKLMRDQIEGEDSKLGRTLEALIGPLLEHLDTDESKGFLRALMRSVEKRLDEQRDRVLEQFSLDKDDSALSRLVKHVSHSEDEIVSQFSLDDDASALSRLRAELIEVLDAESKKNRDFRDKVLGEVSRIATSREEAKRSTVHGLEFEDSVCQFVETESQKLGDVAERTGAKPGRQKNCKVGDCVITLGSDARAAGARIVVEAKEKAGYTLEEARAEIDLGRRNRGAKVGLFVFSRRTAPALTSMQRLGNDVFVVWDAEDELSDVYLLGGVSVARALCTREEVRREAAELDFDELDSTIVNIQKQIEGLDTIRKASDSIKSSSETVLDRVGIMKEQLGKLIEKLQGEVSDIKAHLTETLEE